MSKTVTLRLEHTVVDPCVPASGSPGGAGWAGLASSYERDAPTVTVKTRPVQPRFEAPARPLMLGRYVVLGVLGRGGMGTVFEAFDRTLNRKVAIKVLHQDLDHGHTARLLREARAMAKLSHPNVVSVFETNCFDGQTFVVMELIEGRTLHRWMRQAPSPDWRQCVQVFIQAGQGLAAAHAQDLVHRDFKPSNAIIDDHGRVRVFDFGLVRRAKVELTHDEGPGRARTTTTHNLPLDPPAPPHASRGTMPAWDPLSVQTLTQTGIAVGTPAYMPLEQMHRCEADARTDQFSFCVSLYEAVYGERPFPGSTPDELMASMLFGILRPAPKGSTVPTRLREILLRGLAAQPVERWPSMEVLLHELRTLVAPRTHRWMAIGVTAGLVTLGSGVTLGQYVQIKARCTGAQAQMNGIWDDDRRQQVEAALLDTERAFAPDTWARIEPQLDAYARDWQSAHTEVCEATSVRGEQSDEVLGLRMRCLDQQRMALRATVDMLADADAEVITNAVPLVAGLPALTRCDDLSWLERHDQRVPPPEDPDVATAVKAHRARLVDIEVMHKAGRYAEGLDAVEPVVQQAEVLGYPPLRAEALYWQGILREDDGQYAEAEADLRQAYLLAVEHSHDPVALDTAQALTSVVGYRLARHAEGQQWGQMVALPLAQRSGEPLHEADSLTSLGLVSERQGDYEQARAYHQRALALQQQALGPDHPYVATSLNNLGNVVYTQGDYEQARAHHQRALAIRQKTLGPNHPHVALSLNNLGNAVYRQGDYEQARAHQQRALAIRQKALAPDHPDIAMSLTNLSGIFYRQGDYEQARVHQQRALDIRQEALGPNHPDIAMDLNNLGVILNRQGKPEKARIHQQRALAIQHKALSPDHPHLAYSLSNLSSVLHELGDHETARHYLQRALAIQHKALGPDHPDVAYSLMRLARVALDMGDPASAGAHAERAISVCEAATDEPRLLAEARFTLARALWSTPSERARARTLAEQARDVHAERAQGPDESNDDLAEVDAWLATHRVKSRGPHP
ncbi:MAG: serine/threonine-protein kinase [Myxococcota bacterium]